MNKQAIGYIRVSTNKQVEEGLSLEAQRNKIENWCAYNGYQLVHIYEDAGLSGAKIANRPMLTSALKDTKKSMAFVCYSLSRLTRSIKDLLTIADELKKKDADLVSLTENIDTTSAAGKLMFRMMGILAEFEREIIGERTRLGMQAKKAKGEYTGGKVPYGYKLASDNTTLVQISKEQTLLSTVKNLYHTGCTLRAISEKLSELGYANRKGMPFHIYQLSRMLR
jgi:site-specific DNA recombinase